MITDIPALLLIFWNMPYYFGMIMFIKNVDNLQIAKIQPHGVA